MKGFYFLLYIVTSLLFTGFAYSAEKGEEKKSSGFPNPYITTYPFKSAIIYYSGKIEYGHYGAEGKTKTSRGTEVVYIKGDKLAKEIKVTVPSADGKPKNMETLRIIAPDYVYMIDLVNKKGTKLDNAKKYGKAEYSKLSEEEKKAFHERMERRGIISLDLLGLGKKVGTDTILGRECDVYESGKKLTSKEMLEALQSGAPPPFYMKSWIWREAKIPLKIITEQMGSSRELVATNIKENVEVPDSRFKVPSGVEITYDEKQSEIAKEGTLARFRLYKTGKPMIYKVKVEKHEIAPKDASEKNGTGQKAQGGDKKKESNNWADTYSERIYNYISNIFN